MPLCRSWTCSRTVVTTGDLLPTLPTMWTIPFTPVQVSSRSTHSWPPSLGQKLATSQFTFCSVIYDQLEARQGRSHSLMVIHWPNCSILSHAPTTHTRYWLGSASPWWLNVYLQAYLLWQELTRWLCGLWESIGTTKMNSRIIQKEEKLFFPSYFEQTLHYRIIHSMFCQCYWICFVNIPVLHKQWFMFQPFYRFIWLVQLIMNCSATFTYDTMKRMKSSRSELSYYLLSCFGKYKSITGKPIEKVFSYFKLRRCRSSSWSLGWILMRNLLKYQA